MQLAVLPFYSKLLIQSKQGWSCYISSEDLQGIDNMRADLIADGYTPNKILEGC